MSKRKKHALAWALFWTAMTLAVPGAVVAAALHFTLYLLPLMMLMGPCVLFAGCFWDAYYDTF